MRSVLILNAGSSSLKWLVLDAMSEAVRKQGSAAWHGVETGRHAAEMAAALDDLPRIDAVGHRVVHGGSRFRGTVRIDDAVRRGIEELNSLAPLHNPAALAGIDVARRRFPELPQFAAFDTAFHSSIPEYAAVYPLPYEWTARWDLRRFGFHGLSVQYTVTRATELLQRMPRRLVVCHLGAGCSVTAVLDGRSLDTSMGFTPLEGLMMARRSGSVDPGLLLHLLRNCGLTVADLDHGLNVEAGLLGVSGLSADMRDVLAAAEQGQQRARLAVDMFVQRLVATIGASVATLGGIDALVFTGGIGEHSAVIRARAVASLAHLGGKLDTTANESAPADTNIAVANTPLRILVIAAREDLVILRDVRRLMDWQ